MPPPYSEDLESLSEPNAAPNRMLGRPSPEELNRIQQRIDNFALTREFVVVDREFYMANTHESTPPNLVP